MPRVSLAFKVRLAYLVSGDWEETDRRLYAAAGRRSDASGAGHIWRDHSWRVSTLSLAVAMRKRIEVAVPGITVTVREE